jgi:hypothetical protein
MYKKIAVTLLFIIAILAVFSSVSPSFKNNLIAKVPVLSDQVLKNKERVQSPVLNQTVSETNKRTSYENSNAPECSCPYKIMSIAGTGSDGKDSFSKWIKTHFPATLNSNYPLNNQGHDVTKQRVESIKKGIEQELNQTPKKKILIIGYSLGGSVGATILSELGEKAKCAELFPIDPPTRLHPSIPRNKVASFFASRFRVDVNNILKGQKSILSNPNYINWTGGTAGAGHDPFSDPENEENAKKLEDLTLKLKKKIDSCVN